MEVSRCLISWKQYASISRSSPPDIANTAPVPVTIAFTAILLLVAFGPSYVWRKVLEAWSFVQLGVSILIIGPVFVVVRFYQRIRDSIRRDSRPQKALEEKPVKKRRCKPTMETSSESDSENEKTFHAAKRKWTEAVKDKFKRKHKESGPTTTKRYPSDPLAVANQKRKIASSHRVNGLSQPPPTITRQHVDDEPVPATLNVNGIEPATTDTGPAVHEAGSQFPDPPEGEPPPTMQIEDHEEL